MTKQQREKLEQALENIPDSLQDILAEIANIESKRRRAGLSNAIALIVSGSVSNWGALETAARNADGSSTIEALRAFKTALEARNNDIVPLAVAACLAGLKQQNI